MRFIIPLFIIPWAILKFIRLGTVKIGVKCSDDDVLVTAVKNLDNTIVVVVFNEKEEEKKINLVVKSKTTIYQISSKSIQTIIV